MAKTLVNEKMDAIMKGGLAKLLKKEGFKKRGRYFFREIPEGWWEVGFGPRLQPPQQVPSQPWR